MDFVTEAMKGEDMDLRNRLKMAGNALLGMLDPEKDLMPIGGYETAHNLGRWWDAVLRLEETIGFVIPADLEAASLRNLGCSPPIPMAC